MLLGAMLLGACGGPQETTPTTMSPATSTATSQATTPTPAPGDAAVGPAREAPHDAGLVVTSPPGPTETPAHSPERVDATAVRIRCRGPGNPRRFEDLAYLPEATQTFAAHRRTPEGIEYRLSWTAYGWEPRRTVRSPWAVLASVDDETFAGSGDLPASLAATHRMNVAAIAESADGPLREVFVVATPTSLVALRPPDGLDIEPRTAFPLDDDTVAVLHRTTPVDRHEAPPADCYVSVVHADGSGRYATTHHVPACRGVVLGAMGDAPALYDEGRLRRVSDDGALVAVATPPQPDTARLPLCVGNHAPPLAVVPTLRRLHVVGRDAAELSEPSISIDSYVASPTTSATVELRADGWCLRSLLVGRDLLVARGADRLSGWNVTTGGRLDCVLDARTPEE